MVKTYEGAWKKCPDYVNDYLKYRIDGGNPRIATKIKNCYWCDIIGDTRIPLNTVTSWGVKVLKSGDDNGKDIYIGVAPFDIKQNESHNNDGWYFDCYYSRLSYEPPHNYWDKEYGPRKENGQYVHTGDSIGVVMDTIKGELSFVLNGVNRGVAHRGIPLNKPLVPCVILEWEGDSVELIT